MSSLDEFFCVRVSRNKHSVVLEKVVKLSIHLYFEESNCKLGKMTGICVQSREVTLTSREDKQGQTHADQDQTREPARQADSSQLVPNKP